MKFGGLAILVFLIIGAILPIAMVEKADGSGNAILESLAQVEYQPGEKRAEALFNEGRGPAWIGSGSQLVWSGSHPQRPPIYSWEECNCVECYLIAVKEEVTTGEESWAACVQYSDKYRGWTSGNFEPAYSLDQEPIYIGPNLVDFVGTVKAIMITKGTSFTVNVVNHDGLQPLRLAIYKIDCTHPSVIKGKVFDKHHTDGKDFLEQIH
jgi:hypothetical protein